MSASHVSSTIWHCDLCGRQVAETTSSAYPENLLSKVFLNDRPENYLPTSRCNHVQLDVCSGCQRDRSIGDLIEKFQEGDL